MIPKTINYCWFGEKNIPTEFLEYINGWGKIMPEYTVVRWDESNYDLNCCAYVKEAALAKKWAFVSDYARFDILYKGGYLFRRGC